MLGRDKHTNIKIKLNSEPSMAGYKIQREVLEEMMAGYDKKYEESKDTIWLVLKGYSEVKWFEVKRKEWELKDKLMNECEEHI